MKHCRAIYVLAVLSLITALNYYDRNLITILVEDIKRDLRLSDTEIGLLTGLGFALVYSIASIPIARYADNGRRVRVLGIALTVWSVMTAMSGFAGGFFSMLAARLGVGFGEAGGAPTTHAIVAETFSARRRATALGIIGLAGPIGLMTAMAGGGYIVEHYGWRTAFFVGAVPGVVLALLLVLTVRETRADSTGAERVQIRARQAVRILLGRKAFVWVSVGMAIAGLGAFGAAAWAPAYLMRHFELSASQAGSLFSGAVGASMLASVVVGGVLGDWLSRRDARWPFYLLAICFLVTAPMSVAMFMIDDLRLYFGLSIVSTFIGTLYLTPMYAAIQSLSGPGLRATGAAAFMLVVNLVGQGFGPVAVGGLSDLLASVSGKDSLREALIATAVTNVIGGLCFLAAARTARRDIDVATDGLDLVPEPAAHDVSRTERPRARAS